MNLVIMYSGDLVIMYSNSVFYIFHIVILPICRFTYVYLTICLLYTIMYICVIFILHFTQLTSIYVYSTGVSYE